MTISPPMRKRIGAAHRRRLVLGLAAAIAAITAARTTAAPPGGWKTYRSEQFGYELSYPADLELKVYFGGRSAELRHSATGKDVVELDVWPGDLCPRETPGTTAKALGMERAEATTQADGADGSSSCGKPIAVRESASDVGVRLYELELTCRGERIVGRRVTHERLGKKGPTFFADISQPWRSRVLMADPAGVDPRMAAALNTADAALVRQILATLVTFAVQDPKIVCIDDLVGRPFGAVAVPAEPTR